MGNLHSSLTGWRSQLHFGATRWPEPQQNVVARRGEHAINSAMRNTRTRTISELFANGHQPRTRRAFAARKTVAQGELVGNVRHTRRVRSKFESGKVGLPMLHTQTKTDHGPAWGRALRARRQKEACAARRLAQKNERWVPATRSQRAATLRSACSCTGTSCASAARPGAAARRQAPGSRPAHRP